MEFNTNKRKIRTPSIERNRRKSQESSSEDISKNSNDLICDDEHEEIQDLYRDVPEVHSHFEVEQKIGEGTFSSVYCARLKSYPDVERRFALKHVIPTSHPSRIENELKCLMQIGGCDNVMGIDLCVRNQDNIVMVMPFLPHQRFQDYLPLMNLDEARQYMYNLLIALRRVHTFSVIHRDVKPANFLYDRHNGTFALVDFGLATGPILSQSPAAKARSQQNQFTKPLSIETENPGPSKFKSGNSPRKSNTKGRIPLSPSKNEGANINNIQINLVGNQKTFIGQKKLVRSASVSSAVFEKPNAASCDCYGKPMICELCISRRNQVAPRAGTSGFRPPEVLMKSPDQSTAVDMWSAGVIFLSILSGRYPFFRAQDDLGFLSQIITILGTDVVANAALSFGKKLTVSEHIPKTDLRVMCTKLRSTAMTKPQCQEVLDSWAQITDQPFDLLSKLLDPNPRTRITADRALQHPFFNKMKSAIK